MKTETHPKYYKDAKVTCACGSVFSTGSTLPEIRIALCSNCHPFFTGKQKFVDTQRRVERFKEKADKKTTVGAVRKGKSAKHAVRTAKKASSKK